jgi:hypothetical protein
MKIVKTMWDLFVELNNLEEDIDRLTLERSRSRKVDERARLEREADIKLARMLEIKNKLQGIETLI